MTTYECPGCKRKVQGKQVYYGVSRGWQKCYGFHTVRPTKSREARRMKEEGWVPAPCDYSYQRRKS